MPELKEFTEYNVIPGPISVEDIKVLYGANYFSGGPVVRFRINLGEFDEVYTNSIPGFFEKLKARVPSLYRHHCSVGRVGGFFERVQEGTLLGHVMEHTAIELQNLAGMDVGFGKTRGAKKKGIYNVVFRYFDEIAGIYAGKAALNLINAILEGSGMDVSEIVSNLIIIREKRLLGPSTQAIVHEAERRKIPVLRLDKYNQVQLGTGKFKKLIRATITEDTSLLAVETSDDKYLTNSILQDAGIPVPQQIITENLQNILAFHEKVQRPIVVKPAQGYQGKRISIDLNTPQTIEKAFNWAKEFHKEVVAQEDIPGGSYRILVIDFKLVAAVRLIPAYITGNGIDTISLLIEKVNLEPEREFGDKGKLSKVEIDEDTLKIIELRGFTIDSVLPQGETIFLKNTGNMRLGASATDVTDRVHPFNAFLACRVAKILNLNVAGIDIISEDISQPMNLNNGKVIEVNAAPDFRMHFNPTFGTRRYIQRDYVSMLFPNGTESSVPIYSITGSKGKSLCASIIKEGLAASGLKIGSVGRSGLYINDFCIVSGDATESKNVAIVLKDPTIDCVILETPVESVLSSGLGYEYAHFGIILNLIDQKQEYYTYDHIRDIEDIAYAKMVVAEQVFNSGYVILNADLKEITEMKSRIYSRVAMFSRNRNNQIFSKHINNRGVGIILENDQILVIDNGFEISVVEATKIPLLSLATDDFAIDAVLASVLTLYLSDISIDAIRKVLLSEQFVS
jgi:cyanophycin synthetase